MEVSFDGNNATVGATMALYDGTRLLVSQTLDAAAIAAGKIRLSVTTSLDAGTHVLTSKYSEVSGDTSTSSEFTLDVPADVLAQPFLSDLKVKLSGNADSTAKALGTSTASYANILDPGAVGDRGISIYSHGPSFIGTLGTLNSDNSKSFTGKYLVSVNMGGKLLGFSVVDLDAPRAPGDARAQGSFEISTGANLLTPGLYNDLSFTVTNITANSPSKGQTTSLEKLALGYYWVPQNLENVRGGPGNDEIFLGTTKDGRNTAIQTGTGRDTLIVGKFSNVGRSLEATVTDFELGVDAVKVFLRQADGSLGYQSITEANWRQFAKQADQSNDGAKGTKLVIDLDGGGAGSDKYTLYLPTVPFNYETNTKSIFGL
ncbi:hypothetical protein [Herbaspirillum frisingense]|uniref:hypothetical protein n=1 Tax=Herbaspirillum frisingense TaxID=92645 RepID=UPI001F3CADF7|nr:hypothetical protein [Herbaspirillum frisingense]UIN22419.1 hypothetical protein LAZ82_04725 [Herbaspirillum frisingense]